MPPLTPFPVELRGRYRPLRELGRGGMGVVLLALDEELSREVVVKLCLAPGDEKARVRARREGEALAQLRHPHVVRVYAAGDSAQGPYLVMEVLEGGSLADPQPGMNLEQTFRQVAEGLDAIHAAGLLHRDLKPENILLAGDGRAVISDFGLVKDSERTALTATGRVVGTLAYMAPELLKGGAPTRASDWYGWGASLFACLQGRLPYSSEDLIRHATSGSPLSLDLGGIPPGTMRRALTSTLDLDPARRRSPAQLMAGSSGARTTHQLEPTATPMAGAPTAAAAPIRRSPIPLLVIGAALSLLVGWRLARSPPKPPSRPRSAEAPAAPASSETELASAGRAMLARLPPPDPRGSNGVTEARLITAYPAFASLRFEPVLEDYLDAAVTWLDGAPLPSLDPVRFQTLVEPAAQLALLTRGFRRRHEASLTGAGAANLLGLGSPQPHRPLPSEWDREALRQRLTRVRNRVASAICRIEEADPGPRPEAALFIVYAAYPLELLNTSRDPEIPECDGVAPGRAARLLEALRAAPGLHLPGPQVGLWLGAMTRLLGSLSDPRAISLEARRAALDELDHALDSWTQGSPRESVRHAGSALQQRLRLFYVYPGELGGTLGKELLEEATQAEQRFRRAAEQAPAAAPGFLAGVLALREWFPHIRTPELDPMHLRLEHFQDQLHARHQSR